METTQSTILSEVATTGQHLPLSWNERLFIRLLRNLKYGSVRVIFPSGASRMLGDHSYPVCTLQIQNKAFFKKVFAGGSVGLGEAYVDGDWDTPDLTRLLTVFANNQKDLGRVRQGFSLMTQYLNRVYHRARRNTLEKSVVNIQAHYDLSNDFYATFLDPTMTYSSACFASTKDRLEDAQWRKIDRMLDLTGVQPGDSILEIGSGWGALAQRAAERGCCVRTVTLSKEQFDYAKARFEQAGVTDRVQIEMLDYRNLDGQYDAVISCEMIEAVGREYLESYFAKIRDCLKPGAKAVIQAITIPDDRYERYSRSCDWIQKYIFPGGHLPSPGAIEQHVAHAGKMQVKRMQGFGRDYAETLKRWAAAFNASQERVSALGFDAEFCRKWNYYFSYCEAGFLTDLIDVKHVVIGRDM